MKVWVLLLLVTAASAKRFTRCELARTLKAAGMSGFRGVSLANWVCLVNSESSYNTQAININRDGSGDYGLFQINSHWWCSNGRSPSYNTCRISCSQLLTDDISTAIRCAKTIVSQQGITACTMKVWVLLLLVMAASAKRFTRCELARTLKAAGMSGFRGVSLANWVCLVNSESSYNTQVINRNTDGSKDYGIFQINSRWWCSNGQSPSHNTCRISCSQLLTDNISTAIRCAKTIVSQQGITACTMKVWVLLLLVTAASAKRFTRCELARTLKAAGMSDVGVSLANWVCLANAESGYNTQATNKNSDGSTDYGIFQINNRWWCSNGQYPSHNICRISCSELLTDDISTAIQCAKTIVRQQGITAW
ncbi:hypothetical protein NFI96_020226 [Prochilodus magdalenae]|nr:hypothetical protein NFI96_020226 [Prochilodus magdalenae]